MCGAKEDRETGVRGRSQGSSTKRRIACRPQRQQQQLQRQHSVSARNNRSQKCADGSVENCTHHKSVHPKQNNQPVRAVAPSLPFLSYLARPMTSLSLRSRFSNCQTRQAVTLCPGIGKLPNLDIMVTAEPSKPSILLPGEDHGLTRSTHTTPQGRTTRRSHLSKIPLRRPRQFLCENSKPVTTARIQTSQHDDVGTKDQSSPESFGINITKNGSSGHSRAQRKRCSLEILGGRRISVLKFKKPKIDDDGSTEGAAAAQPRSWTSDKDLSPVACSQTHVVPVKDDQRQTEMERQDSRGSSSVYDILPAPKHNLKILYQSSTVAPSSAGSKSLVHHHFPSGMGTQHFPGKLKDQRLQTYPDILPGGQKGFPQGFELNNYHDLQGDTPELSGHRHVEQLEKGMRHFLTSEIEAANDVSHPWHDMMSTRVSARQEASSVHQNPTLSLATSSEPQFDQFSYGHDDPSLSSFYPSQSWGRGDPPPGGSSPDSSSSDSHYPSGLPHHESAISHRSSLSMMSRHTHKTARAVSEHTSLSSPSMSSEDSLSLEPLPEEGRLMLDAVNGFLVVLDSAARVLYVSENVTEHLGFLQADMLGCNFQDYLHSQDIKELQEHLSDLPFSEDSSQNLPTWKTRRMFYLGMKFSFLKPGTRARETGYTLVQCNAKLRLTHKRCSGAQTMTANNRGRKKGAGHHSQGSGTRRQRGRANVKQVSQQESSAHGLRVKSMILLCRPVRTESVLEIRPDGNMFISRHDLGFHFIFCDPRVATLIGYEPSDMLGRTAYQFHSPWDAIICKHCAKQLILSGTATSGYYRFLSRTGAWVWMVTSATIVYDTRRRPQYIVCKNYVVSSKLAERDLSRQRRDFDMMKYSGFTLETKQPHPLQSTPWGSIGNHRNKSWNYGDAMSLVTLRPKLGDVNPNAMLEELFASKQMDVSNSPFHMMRAMKRGAPTAGTDTREVNGFFNEADHGVHPSTLMGPEGSHMIQSEEASMDVDTLVYSGPHGGAAYESDFIENQYFSSHQKSMQEASERPPSPILTSLWRRDEQDIDFMTSGISVSSESGKMDSSSAFDLLIPSSMANSVRAYHNSKNTVDRGFNSGSLLEEDTVLQRDPYPILTTTNTYNLDFASVLSDTLSSDFGGFPSLLDSPQSIPLTNATSFCAGQDFMFANIIGGGSKILDGSFPAFGSATESDNLERMDTPVCFNDQDQNGSEGNHSTISFSNTHQGSQMSPPTLASVDKDSHGHGNTTDLGNSCSITSQRGSSKSGTNTKGSASSEGKDTNIEMHKGHLTSQNTSNPNNTSILQDIFHGDKHFSASPRNNTNLYRGKTSSTRPVSPPVSWNHRSYSPNQEDVKTKVSIPGVHSKKQNVFPSVSTSIVDSNQTMSSQSRSLDCHSKNQVDDEIATISVQHETTFFSRPSVSSDLESMIKEDETASSQPNSHLPMSDCYSPHSKGRNHNSTNDFNSSCSASKTVVETEQNGICFSSRAMRSPEYNVAKSKTASSETSLASDVPSPICSPTAQMQNLSDSASPSSSDSETSGRPSLLRTLLDKEGAAIQGPVTYAEWVLQKTLKNRKILQSNYANDMSIPFKRAMNKKSKVKRNNMRKSTELPLPKSSHGSVIRHGKDGLKQRKPTTELPLPSIPLSMSQTPGSNLTHPRCSDERSYSGHNESSLTNISSNEFSLPDDLLDFAVEYCRSMGPEQTDALLSDFTEISSLEDNLFSLVGSPAQNKAYNFSQHNQVRADSVKSAPLNQNSHHTSQFTPNFLGDSPLTRSTITNNSDTESSHVTNSQGLDKTILKSDMSKKINVVNNGQNELHIDTSKNPTLDDLNAPSGAPNGSAPMSLLRAAVTTPDMDKLIQQIPFGHHTCYNQASSNQLSKERKLNSNKVDPDVVITKVVNSNKTNETTSSKPSSNEKLYKVSEKSLRKLSDPFSSTTGRLETIFSDHVYTASVMNSQTTTSTNSSALFSPSGPNSWPNPETQKQPTSPRIIVNPSGSKKMSNSSSLGSPSAENGHMRIPDKQGVAPSSRIKVSVNTIFPSPTCSSPSPASNYSASSGCSSKYDFSSTEPVSVMIMRKETPRSRRSKSIAVQTDNAPGEVYPDFERSPNDVILYPRSLSSYTAQNGSAVRPGHQKSNSTETSPSVSPSPSTPTHSPPCMSQLERFLRGYSSFSDGMETVTSPEANGSSPPSSSPPSGPATPFLQRLLTGELSKDNYRRLDEQMREDERRQSGSSASDLELS